MLSRYAGRTCAALLLVVTAIAGSSSTGSAEQRATRAVAGGVAAVGDGASSSSSSRALKVLGFVRSTLSGSGATQAIGRGNRDQGRQDLTLSMRDLVQSLPALSPAHRRTARSLLLRPTDGEADPARNGYRVPAEDHCETNVCVHWVDQTEDAPPLLDQDGDEIPDWVQTNATVLETVWDRVVTDYGYQAPLSDETSTNHGPDERLDVYLLDLKVGVYGYCASDDPQRKQRFSVSAYCVLDNDFSRAEYPGTPSNNLNATAAHEFFHAVQLGYDWLEDKWLMEGTAVWVEDEVFDTINDHHQYFPNSALRQPWVPIDTGRGGPQYGAWVFWRFLAEYFGTEQAADPTVIREVWSSARARDSGRDRHSLAAVVSTVRARGASFRDVFGAFGMVGHVAKRYYFEGASYPQAPIERSHLLTRRSSVTNESFVLDHLTNRSVAFRPGPALQRGWRLEVRLDLPDLARGSLARFTVHRRDGSVAYYSAPVNRRGNGASVQPFGSARVAKVVLTITNASTRTRCWRNTSFSCQGRPLDDALTSVYSARVIR